jgi:hypothetical protein
MKLQELTIGLKVRHPQHGVGTVKSISEKSAEVRFDDAQRTVDPELSGLLPAEPAASLSGLQMPLRQLVANTVEAVLNQMGYDDPNSVVGEMGARWHRGKLVLHPADPVAATKEVPIEVFFHKVVGIRNQLRVLEQKVNAHPNLNDAEKIEMQQYITRCYGSLTTFNLLFKNKEDQFNSKWEA